MGSWGRQQVAPLHLCAQEVSVVLPRKHIWRVNDDHLSLTPASSAFTAGLSEGLGAQLGHKGSLPQDAVPCGTFTGSCFARQDDPQL